jgi:hypothetical protein
MSKSISLISYSSKIGRALIICFVGSVLLLMSAGVSQAGLIQSRANAKSNDLGLSQQADSLTKYAKLIESSSGREKAWCEQMYFKHFPTDFNRFNLLYGYRQISNDSAVYGPLFYSKDLDEMFPHLPAINDTDFYRKLISVSIGGHGESDNVGIFQNILIRKVKEKISLSCSILSGLSNKDLRSFWVFFFDMENPSAIDFSFLKGIKDKRIRDSIRQAWRIDRAKWSHE